MLNTLPADLQVSGKIDSGTLKDIFNFVVSSSTWVFEVLCGEKFTPEYEFQSTSGTVCKFIVIKHITYQLRKFLTHLYNFSSI